MNQYSEAIKSILVRARALENSTIGKQLTLATDIEEKRNSSDKGSFGQYLQSSYFQIPPNPKSEPDFWPIPVELKAAPLKKTSTGALTPKERIVLGIIDYNTIIKETFADSHFLAKNATILIVWYLYSKNLSNKDTPIDLTDIWECVEEDGKQIQEDWELICQKVKDGHAEDISEGDTLFLGACTKGATAETSYREQPNSVIRAKQRAFCFKTSYTKHVYEVMKQRKTSRASETRFIPEGEKETIEQRVYKLFVPFCGKTTAEIEKTLSIHSEAKSRFAVYARLILGFSAKNKAFYEFDAANIQIKTIRVENNNKIREDMSFKNIQFKEIITQEWEDSDLYQELTSKFIFVIFHKTADEQDYYLKEVRFWNMPEPDLDIAKVAWETTRFMIRANKMDNLPKKKEFPIIHVRTKGRNSQDLMETPAGTMETKRCFFLNRHYIESIINSKNF